MPIAPIIALSHGGGPLPLLGDPTHDALVHSMKTRVPQILKLGTPQQPRAIVVVTAHWTTEHPRVSSSAAHNLLYDYNNFPPESYRFKYPASGEPAVARQVREAFRAQGLEAELDGERGWDHGVFVPMLLVRPEADVPIVQVSVLRDADPERHLRMGEALAALRRDNVAVVGSGFASLHNFEAYAAFRRSNSGTGTDMHSWITAVQEWNAALTGAVGAESKEERWRRVKAWRELTHADRMHPPGGEEHFLPLVVCVGAAGEEKTQWYADEFMGMSMLTYYWE